MAKMSMKRSYGQYATPIATVDYMVGKALAHIAGKPDARVLDPAVGDGVFVERLLAHGASPEQVMAYDIDERIVASHRERIPQIRHQDFLLAEGTPFDVIIGNPPYKSKRESRYIRTNSRRLKQQFAAIGTHNLYAMFVCHAIRQLREGGLLIFIIQDSFLTNVYYEAFRLFLLEHGLIREILLAPRRLFHHTDADVRTAIITFEKCSGEERTEIRRQHRMRLVDRLRSEEDYGDPPADRVQFLQQQMFERMEKHPFFINVPPRIAELIIASPTRLSDVVEGGTGISTGNDARFLRKLSPGEPSPEDWVPFYKNGGARDAWFYETPYRMHRDWQTPAAQHRDFLTRNTECYFREGITCSSMGAAFSAAYLPRGCLFGVNANLFTRDPDDLPYVLALLNSSLAQYIIRAVFNRTNMVTAGYIKRLPYIAPPAPTKQRIAALARTIVDRKRADPAYDFSRHQADLDDLIFDVYAIETRDRAVVSAFCANILEAL